MKTREPKKEKEAFFEGQAFKEKMVEILVEANEKIKFKEKENQFKEKKQVLKKKDRKFEIVMGAFLVVYLIFKLIEYFKK